MEKYSGIKDLAPQMAMKNGFGGSFRGSFLGLTTLFTAPNQIPIIASGGIDVCDLRSQGVCDEKGQEVWGGAKIPREIRAVASPALKRREGGARLRPICSPLAPRVGCGLTTTKLQ